MAVINQICASWTDLAKQTKEFQSELLGIESGIHKAVDDVLNGPDTKSLDASLTEALAQANRFFTQQSIGGLNQALRDSGIATSEDTNDRTLNDLGFYRANGRLWRTNAQVGVSSGTQQSYGFSGIGAGEYTHDMIAVVLNRDFEEPTDQSIQEMLQTAYAGTQLRQQAQRTSDAGSVTGSRHVSGNMANLREIYRGCGSNLDTLNLFLNASYLLGFGCVWSTSHVTVVPRPSGFTQDQFNASYVRKQVNTVVFDADLDFTFDSKYCLVREEIYLGHNITRTEAAAVAGRYAKQFDIHIDNLPLISRTVRFKPLEDSIGTSPLLMSRGCDPGKLSSGAYGFGMSVNGIYRVIDVTGDKGQKIVRTNYTIEDIVDSINEVFGDLVECGSVGSEFFIRLKSGFGSLGSISLFYVPEIDCADIIGMQGCINESAQGRALTQDRRMLVPDLSVVKEVLWLGGASEPSVSASSFFTSYLNTSGIDVPRKRALLQQSNYWEDIAAQVTTIRESLVEAYTAGASPDRHISDLEALLVYCDVVNFSYREFKSIVSALGVSLHELLVHNIDVTSLDVFTSSTAVRDNLTNTISTLLSNDGLVPSTSAWASVSLPMDLNYSTAARLRLLHAEATEYSYLNETASAQANSANYAASVASAVNQSTAKTTSSSTFTKILDGVDSLLDATSDLIRTDLNRVIWNLIQDIPGVSDIVGGEQYLERKLAELGEGIDAGIRSVENLVSDLLSSLGISSLNRKAVNILLQAQACLESAQRIVNSIKSTYNATTKKIVSLSNFNVNFSGSLGFQTKYLTCYTSGALNYQSTVSLAKMLEVINGAADALSSYLKKLVDMIDSAIDKILCLLDRLVASLTGSMSYETTMQVGLVTMKASCVSSIALGSTFSPNVLSHIMDLRRQIDFLLASLKLQQVTLKKHEQNLQASGSMFTTTLQDTVDGILSKVTKCF